MAVHNFNYSYEFVSCKTIPLSMNDDTQIVKHVTVRVTAVDQADATKTASVEMQAPLDGIYSYKSNGLPNDFIYFDDVTDAKIIDWYKATTETSDLDVFFTWEIFGVEEVDAITEGGE
jgi:hypothetical protein